MNHRKSNFKNKTKEISKAFLFKITNLPLYNKIILFWSIVWIYSLFMNWITKEIENKSWNSFYSITWNIWYILILLYLLVLFIILSNTFKEKIKLYADVNIKNYIIIITSAVINILLSTVSISFTIWMSTISNNITYWNWVILSLTCWIAILIWWLIIRKEYKKNNSEIILEQLEENRKRQKENDNMTLPI